MPDPKDPSTDHFSEETGASTGDVRENDPRDAGFSDEADRLFRSHFQHANRLADRTYEQARGAYQAGYAAGQDPSLAGKRFDEIERDLESGWLNVRNAGGDWASVRILAQTAFEHSQTQGRITDTTLPDSSERPSYSNPVADA